MEFLLIGAYILHYIRHLSNYNSTYKDKKKEFIMLTEYNNPIDYELNINPLISGVVPDFSIYEPTSLLKRFFKWELIIFLFIVDFLSSSW